MNAKKATTTLVGLLAMTTALAGCIDGTQENDKQDDVLKEQDKRIAELEKQLEQLANVDSGPSSDEEKFANLLSQFYELQNETAELLELIDELQNSSENNSGNSDDDNGNVDENITKLENKMANFLTQLNELKESIDPDEDNSDLFDQIEAMVKDLQDSFRKDLADLRKWTDNAWFDPSAQNSRLRILIGSEDLSWSSLILNHEGCSEGGKTPHLNQTGPPISSGEVVGSGKVNNNANNFIQFYPEDAGCEFELIHESTGTQLIEMTFFPPFPDIAFTMNVNQDRLEVSALDPNRDADWSEVLISYSPGCRDGSNLPHLNAGGPPIESWGMVGNGTIAVGDFIQVYTQVQGCWFEFAHVKEDQWTWIGDWFFQGIFFVANQTDNRLEVESIKSDGDWGDFSINYGNGCSKDGNAPHLNDDGEPISNDQPVGSGAIVPGDFIQVYPDGFCWIRVLFTEPFEEFQEWIGEWGFHSNQQEEV